jgi:t-SNARE complex subunit (syntaxin)
MEKLTKNFDNLDNIVKTIESDLTQLENSIVIEKDDVIMKNVNAIKLKMKEFNLELKKINKLPENEEFKVFSNLINQRCNYYIKKISPLIRKFNQIQEKIRSENKKKVKNLLDVDDQTAEKVIKSGKNINQLIQMKILSDSKPSDFIQNTYLNVNDKYNSVLELEANIAELNKMFIDLALLVDMQGDMLDSIEKNVKSSSDYIDNANLDITQAIEYQIQIRKKQCACVIIVLVVIGLVIGLTIGLYKLKN